MVSAPSAVQNKVSGFFVHGSGRLVFWGKGQCKNCQYFMNSQSWLLLMPSNEPLTYCLETKSSARLMARVTAG